MMLGVTAEQIPGWDAELSALTGSLGFLFNRPEPRVGFAQFIGAAEEERLDAVGACRACDRGPDAVAAQRISVGRRPAAGRGPQLWTCRAGRAPPFTG